MSAQEEYKQDPGRRAVFEKARQALSRKDALAFNDAWDRYRLLTRSDLPGSKPAYRFWDEVLGAAWHGHSAVPAGPARENLVQMLGLRYVLSPYSGKEALPVQEMPQMLQLAAYMAATDRQAIEKMRPSSDEEVPAARVACLQMLEGEWEMAHASFAECFRPRSALLYRILHTGAAPLLAFALLCAIRCDANGGLIEHWVDTLQRLLPESVPNGEEESVISFVHNLQLAGNILNSSKFPRYVPDTDSTMARLPLALCYRALNSFMQSQIIRERLLEAVRRVLEQGPTLLGYYAGTALLGTATPLPADIVDSIQHIQQKGIAPIYADIPPLAPGAVLHPQIIHETLARTTEQQSEKLGWDLVSGKEAGTITGLRSVLYSQRQGQWQTRDLDKCLGAICTEQDLAGLFIAGGAEGSALAPDWISALAEHPRLRLAAPGKRTVPIRLHAEKPRIRIYREGGFIFVEPENTDYRKLRRISAQEWGVLRHSPSLESLRYFINTYGTEGKLRFPENDADELYRLLGEWEQDFLCIGSLAQGDEAVAEDCRLVAAVQVSATGVEIRLGIHLLPGSEKIYTPAIGSVESDVRTPAGIFRVRRDFEQEAKCMENALKRCPILHTDREFSQCLETEQEALEGLAQLESAGFVLLKNGRERLRCFTPAIPYIELHTRSLGSEWFDIGGELKVDETLTLQLRELLDALPRRSGPFIPIDGGYLHLPATMERQLTTLHALMSVKGRAPGLSTAAVPALAKALGEENIPRALRDRLKSAAHAAELQAPKGLQAVLRPYQLMGFRWLAERAAAGIGSCLADDMGLGKTVQLIALLLHLAPKGPSLVVTPLSLQSNWARELARFAPGLRVLPFSPNQAWHVPQAGEVVLASYGQLTRSQRSFSSVAWNVLALDEAQAIKNPESQRSKAVCTLPAFARVCLTGTPVENSETDLWSLMRFLNPLLFGTRASYRRRFLDKRGANDPLADIVATLFLRRRKEEVLTELPKLVEQVLPIELDAEERAVYEAVRRRTLAELDKGSDRISVLAELTRLRRACCHGRLVIPDFSGLSSKLAMLLHVLEELRENGHKALVFSQFTDVLDLVEPMLEQSKFRFERLDGSHTENQRTRSLDRFHQGKADVFLISLKAGGVGLNLTEADYVILLDPWWNPAVESQAASRSHRMGQKRPVTLYRLIAQNTVEEKIIQLHEAKNELAASLLAGAVLSLDEIRPLLGE